MDEHGLCKRSGFKARGSARLPTAYHGTPKEPVWNAHI